MPNVQPLHVFIEIFQIAPFLLPQFSFMLPLCMLSLSVKPLLAKVYSTRVTQMSRGQLDGGGQQFFMGIIVLCFFEKVTLTNYCLNTNKLVLRRPLCLDFLFHIWFLFLSSCYKRNQGKFVMGKLKFGKRDYSEWVLLQLPKLNKNIFCESRSFTFVLLKNSGQYYYLSSSVISCPIIGFVSTVLKTRHEELIVQRINEFAQSKSKTQ